jgi:hypothetical protein
VFAFNANANDLQLDVGLVACGESRGSAFGRQAASFQSGTVDGLERALTQWHATVRNRCDWRAGTQASTQVFFVTSKMTSI